MRIKQSAAMPPALAEQMKHLGKMLVRLRHARRMKQSEAALRAGISRATALRMEQGDAGVAIGIVIRYIDAIAPTLTLLRLLSEDDPSFAVLEERWSARRVRDLTADELKDLDF